MKPYKLLLFFVLSFSFQTVYSQDQDRQKPHAAKFYSVSDSSIVEGYLYQLKESSVAISGASILNPDLTTLREMEVKEIQRIEFRKKGGFGRRFLIGSAAGLVAGALIGFIGGGSSGNFVSFSPGETALMAGISLGVAGGLIYGFVGGASVSIDINGNKENYYKQHRKLKKYALVD